MLQKPFFRATASATGADRRGRRITRSVTRLSQDSPEDAIRIAEADARRLVEKTIAGEVTERRYGYGERLVVEPVVTRIGEPGTPGSAFISINSYGSQVLNAEKLMFVDVDLPEQRSGFLARLFGTKSEAQPHQPALDRLADLVASRPNVRVRTYRTAAGLRYIFVHAPHDATAGETASLMNRLGTDEKYVLLCRVQKCFRARLTPKPWRCGISRERPGFNGNSEEVDPAFLEWQLQYDRTAASYATCQFLEEYGSGAADPALKDLVTLHDQITRSSSGNPLA